MKQSRNKFEYKGKTFKITRVPDENGCEGCAFEVMEQYDGSDDPCKLSDKVRNCLDHPNAIWVEVS